MRTAFPPVLTISHPWCTFGVFVQWAPAGLCGSICRVLWHIIWNLSSASFRCGVTIVWSRNVKYLVIFLTLPSRFHIHETLFYINSMTASATFFWINIKFFILCVTRALPLKTKTLLHWMPFFLFSLIATRYLILYFHPSFQLYHTP